MCEMANPVANVNKLGLVIDVNESITVTNSIGTVIIEHITPTQRRIVLDGHPQEFQFSKSSYNYGIFGTKKFKHGSINNISGLSYRENTYSFYSETELQKFLRNYDADADGYEHRKKDQMIISCSVGEGNMLYINLWKYEFSDPNGERPPWGYVYH